MTTSPLCKNAELLSTIPSLQTACCVKDASHKQWDAELLDTCYRAQSGMAGKATYDAIQQYMVQQQAPAVSRCSNSAYVKAHPNECCHTYDGQTLGQMGFLDDASARLCPIARI